MLLDSYKAGAWAQDDWRITDNLTIPMGAHRFTVGTQNQFYKVRNLFGQYSYGYWRFSSLDSLRTGTPYASSPSCRTASSTTAARQRRTMLSVGP